MSFERSVRELSQGLAAVLDEGPYAEQMTQRQAQASLAYRNYTVQRLQAAVAATLDLPAYVPEVSMQETFTHPAHAMHEALGRLESGPVAEPRAAVEDSHHRLMHAWEDTAVAAMMVSRTGDLERLRGLNGVDAWAAVRDLSELVAAVPLADADLAAVLPPGTAEHAWLTDPIAHRVLQQSTAEVRAQLADVTGGDYLRALDGPTHPQPVRLSSPQQLPAGLRRLTDIVRSVGPELSRTDLRAVLQVVSGAAVLASRQLQEQAARGGPTADGMQVAAARIATLPAAARELHGAQLEMLTRVDPRVRAMAQEVFTTLKAHERTPTAAVPVQAWASEVTQLGTTVAENIGRALVKDHLVVPGTPHEDLDIPVGWRNVDDRMRHRVANVLHEAATTGTHTPRETDEQWVTAVAGFTATAHAAAPAVREAAGAFARPGAASVNATSGALSAREMAALAGAATERVAVSGMPRAAHPRTRPAPAEGVPRMRRSFQVLRTHEQVRAVEGVATRRFLNLPVDCDEPNC